MIIEPKILKGFRDFLPEQEIERRRIAEIIESVCKRGGFVPIDTPVLEYEEVLLGKGGGETDKQVYRFSDHGKRDVAMRFDLTVPFARYVALHYHDLYMPFKRYHISKVWRGENTQRGRYREFMQCDFDIVGTDSINADFEILMLIYESFQAMSIENITIKISHRGIFNALLADLGIAEKQVEILRAVDKLAKIGEEKMTSLLNEIIDENSVKKILDFITPAKGFSDELDKLKKFFDGPQPDIERISSLYTMMTECGIEKVFALDTSITRGLDYYTGIVYETILNDVPGIGSVCSGGRYDNLASLYTKEIIPGVGASIGLDRLMTALEDLGLLSGKQSTLQAIVFQMDEKFGGYYQNICRKLRMAGIHSEVFLEQKKLGAQFKHAEKKGIPYAIICGEEEYNNGTITLKDLNERKNISDISLDKAIEIIKGSKS